MQNQETFVVQEFGEVSQWNRKGCKSCFKVWNFVRTDVICPYMCTIFEIRYFERDADAYRKRHTKAIIIQFGREI